MKKRLSLMLLAAVLAFIPAACEKEPPAPEAQDSILPEPQPPVDSTQSRAPWMHALVLNEGPQGNNASLSWIDLADGTLVADWFSAVNGRGLGNVAQDLLVYGSKAYVTVWASGSLEVIDTLSGMAVHVDLGNRGPRYIAADGGKLYITCYNPHSVIRIDTSSLAVEATCLLGDYNPEGIAALGGKLYVASDNISDATGNYSYDDRLYVVDQATFAVDTTLVVGRNPQKVMALDATHLVVNCWGAWDLNTGSTTEEGSAIVDISDLSVVQTGRLMTNMTVHGGQVYAYASTYDASWTMTTTFFRLDPSTLAVEPLLSGCGINNPYAIAVHPSSGNIYVATDGNYTANGDLHCFTPDGTRRWRRQVGLLPSKIVFF